MLKIYKNITVIIPIFFVFLFLNCAATGPNLSPMQIRQITTKLISGSYEDTYRSTLTVLQDQGYIIKNTDMASGLISAQVDREASGGSQFAQAFILGYISDKGSVIEFSCMVNRMNENNTELRINIQETGYGQSSAWTGTSKQRVKQIYTPELYKKIFDQILIEVKRRQAISSMSNPSQNNNISDDISNLSNDGELESLLKESNIKFIEIRKILKNYVLIYSDENTSFKLYDVYEIIRESISINGKIEYNKIGSAKVKKIQDNKVVLEIKDSTNQIQIGDKIKYF